MGGKPRSFKGKSMTMTIQVGNYKRCIGVRYPSRFGFDTHTGIWTSEDGNYTVWLQGRLLHGEREWAAQFQNEEWLTATAADRTDAIKECKDHFYKMEQEGALELFNELTKVKE